MKHEIEDSQHGPRTPAMAQAIQNCVHCGFCLAACPTYQVLEEEMDSPRGRIYLMKSVLEDQLDAQDAQPYIDRCLGCMACVPACPSGVAYGDLLVGYRAVTEQSRKRPLIDAASRKLIAGTLPYPGRFRMAARTGKLGKLVEGMLPEKFSAMLGLLPETLPEADALPEVVPAKGARRARVALLSGCVQEVLAPQINRAALQVLAANGIEVVIPQGQGCCGSILLHIGEDKQAQRLARKNIATFPQDVDAILTTAAGCGSGMHDYPLLFAGENDLPAAQAFTDKVCDISVFLDQVGLLDPPDSDRKLKVAYHDACHLLHAQGVNAAPRNLLQAIPNLTLFELDDEGLCCGSAGVYNLEQPEIAAELGRRKAERIRETGAEVVVSGNIGCLTQIQAYLTKRSPDMRIMHTIELLAEVYQRPHP